MPRRNRSYISRSAPFGLRRADYEDVMRHFVGKVSENPRWTKPGWSSGHEAGVQPSYMSVMISSPLNQPS